MPLKYLIALFALCAVCFAQGSREKPCPAGQHMEGDYDRVYACVPDSDSVGQSAVRSSNPANPRAGMLGNLDAKVEDGVLRDNSGPTSRRLRQKLTEAATW